MNAGHKFLKSYLFSIILVVSILIGSAIGFVLGDKAVMLKPLGDVFLNLLFTLAVPMVFFSLSMAASSVSDKKRLGRIFGWMIFLFTVTGIISSLIMVVGVRFYPPATGVSINLGTAEKVQSVSAVHQFINAFTVPDFVELLSRKNMLALIVFSVLIGLSASAAGEKGKAFIEFLRGGNAVTSKALSYVMLYAPIGLGAYFAYLVGVFGPQLLGAYFRVVMLYYPIALLYFAIFFSLYAWFAGGITGIKRFWSNIIPPALTAWATGSSIATIPANLAAAERIGVSEDVREIVIPIGATIHMDGSCIAAVLKISFLFGIFGIEFKGTETMLMTVGAALLSGIVMSGIPGGGFLGELMIVNLFGFPPQALPVISMIGTLVDPPATMINSTGDTVVSMMISRIVDRKSK